MRWATVRHSDGSTNAARVEADGYIELATSDVGELIRQSAVGNDVAETGRVFSSDDVALAPVVVTPGKIICVGRNYMSHIRELGRELPDYPTLFAKFTSTLIGAEDVIELPADATTVDWEAELAFVIGRPTRHASPSEARNAIAGYTIANDVTERTWQFRTAQWLAGKNLEASTPVGPTLVSPDVVDHGEDLEVRCLVDDIEMQSARTSDLLFKPTDIVQYISEFISLDPGDLILSGTPGGVGHAMDPPQYLNEGNVVRTSVEGIGELVNPCRKH
ncbi:MAG: fumarylacetoacetate hydrolase family protein [bacterium]|nr:fumarylacetoacetate hydrolase family protein [bacterium]